MERIETRVIITALTPPAQNLSVAIDHFTRQEQTLLQDLQARHEPVLLNTSEGWWSFRITSSDQWTFRFLSTGPPGPQHSGS